MGKEVKREIEVKVVQKEKKVNKVKGEKRE